MSPTLPPLPLVGREAELGRVRALLERAGKGQGGMLVFAGESGIGKSRLLRTAAEDAEGRGWSVAVGRAYPVETGIPYAPVADLLLPLLRGLSPGELAALTRGEAELGWLIPTLQQPRPESQPEHKTRLLWSFTELLGRLAERSPLLLLADDLQWADASSLELLHFAARHLDGRRVAIVASYNPTQGGGEAGLRALEQSLAVHRIGPLTREGTDALVRALFPADEDTARELAELLFGWTEGNPFFIEEILKTLAQSGRLALRDGRWRGADLRAIELPRSIREAVLDRVATLSSGAREVAELLAVLGTSARYDEIREVAAAEEDALVEALEELRRGRVLDERLEGAAVVYDFTHPMLRETLYGGLGLARARLLHARVAAALEALHGANAGEHAGRLAYHLVRSHARDGAKAARYLAVAGREALARYASREAADYLSAALERGDDPALVEDLARARQRLGDFDGAAELWMRARAAAERSGDDARAGAAERRLGLIRYWGGRYPEALGHFAAGLDRARRAGDEPLAARLRLARAECFMEMGSPADARAEVEDALGIAERLADPPLLVRVHLVLLLLHTWTGAPPLARAHGERALALAGAGGAPELRCMLHWGMGMLAGLTGDAPAIRRHVAECQRLADELRSPIHALRAAELSIELMSNTGEWDAALALAERTVASARALRQRTILARLLVWTGLIHVGRGDLERGRACVDEAWVLSGAGDPEQPLDVHTVVPAHCGRAAYHLAAGELAEAVRVGEAGLAVADRTGYTVWAMHRLLPIMAEAYLSMGDVERATRVGARLRADAERLGHDLGVGWADACDAFLVWLRGDVDGAVLRLRAAAERLESVPVIPAAARLRRHFAARLRDSGRAAEALRELRQVHETFARLGAARELAKTREQMRELGARPPSRGEDAHGGLTAREAEIARLVAERKSNKTIARTLDISPRTVTTHLSNIFRKLEIGSRGELVDRVRRPDG